MSSRHVLVYDLPTGIGLARRLTLTGRWKSIPRTQAAIRWMAEHLIWMGRLPEVLPWDRRRIEKEPLSSSAWNDLGVDYWFLGRFGEAESAFSRALEVDPSLRSWPTTWARSS